MNPFIVIGLGYGDEGKGTLVDALTRHHNLGLVVRHNGGAQAAHNVWTDDGRHHVFSQFGSGSFVPGVKTLLSRFMLVNPAALLNEHQHLASVGVTDIFERTFVDSRALVTTPWHIVLNRLKEAERGDGRHGSCGMGIGETVADSLERPEAIVVGDLLKCDLYNRLENTLTALCQKYPRFSDVLRRNTIVSALARMQLFCDMATIVTANEAATLIKTSHCAFEGAQGVLLDQDFGVQPHTTWSKTTDANALALLKEAGVTASPIRIGVTRWFMTRHGAGPFATEDSELEKLIADDDNGTGEFQGVFRVGRLDRGLLRHAISVNNGIDYLAVTHLDKAKDAQAVIETLSSQIGVPIGITSRGKTAAHKQFNITAPAALTV